MSCERNIKQKTQRKINLHDKNERKTNHCNLLIL